MGTVSPPQAQLEQFNGKLDYWSQEANRNQMENARLPLSQLFKIPGSSSTAGAGEQASYLGNHGHGRQGGSLSPLASPLEREQHEAILKERARSEQGQVEGALAPAADSKANVYNTNGNHQLAGEGSKQIHAIRDPPVESNSRNEQTGGSALPPSAKNIDSSSTRSSVLLFLFPLLLSLLLLT